MRLISALIRTIQSFSSVAVRGKKDERPLAWARSLLEDTGPEVLRAFERLIPETTLALKELNVQVLNRLLPTVDPDDDAERARLLNNLANMQSEVGRARGGAGHGAASGGDS